MLESCADLPGQVVELLRRKIRSGVFTESSLARAAGLSQPHMHHIINGLRVPSLPACDQLLKAIGSNLHSALGVESGLEPAVVPLLKHKIGPGSLASFDAIERSVTLERDVVSPLTQPVLARLGADLSLPSVFRAGDIVLLSQNTEERECPN